MSFSVLLLSQGNIQNPVTVLEGQSKFQSESGQLILQIHRSGKACRVRKRLLRQLFLLRLFFVFLQAPLFQRIQSPPAQSAPVIPRAQALRSARQNSSFLDNAYALHHFTAPAIPLAKLFCRHKKMTAVGRVQIRTPSISIP